MTLTIEKEKVKGLKEGDRVVATVVYEDGTKGEWVAEVAEIDFEKGKMSIMLIEKKGGEK